MGIGRNSVAKAACVGILIIGVFFLLGMQSQRGQITSPYVPLSIAPGFRTASLKIGEVAPVFEVETIDGENIRLDEIGNPAFILFSSTWCPSCHEILEAAKRVYPKYEDRVALIIINADLTEDKETIKRYRDANTYPGKFAIGNGDLITDYRVISTSTKYGIRDGIIVYSDVGPLNEKHLTEAFERLLES